jgi:hypothetical protein
MDSFDSIASSTSSQTFFEYDDKCLYCRYSEMTPTAIKYGKKLERYFYKDIYNLMNEDGIRRLLIEKGTEIGDQEMINDGYMCLEQMYEFNRRFSECMAYCEEIIIEEMGPEQGSQYIYEIQHYIFVPETITKDQQNKINNMGLPALYNEKTMIEEKMVYELRRLMIFEYSGLLPYFNAIVNTIKTISKSWVDTEDEDEYEDEY